MKPTSSLRLTVEQTRWSTPGDSASPRWENKKSTQRKDRKDGSNICHTADEGSCPLWQQNYIYRTTTLNMNESTIKSSYHVMFEYCIIPGQKYNLPSVFLTGVFEAVFFLFFLVASGLSQSSITCHRPSSAANHQLRLMDRTRIEGSRCSYDMKPTGGQPVRTAGQLTLTLAQRMLGVKWL